MNGYQSGTSSWEHDLHIIFLGEIYIYIFASLLYNYAFYLDKDKFSQRCPETSLVGKGLAY